MASGSAAEVPAESRSKAEEERVSIFQLGLSIMTLFVPLFAARLSWIGMKTTDTALLGHSGTDYLTASSLADFWTGAFAPFLMDSVLGSKLGPAYGAKNYDNVGIWVQVSTTLYSWAMIPVFMSFVLTGPALQHLIRTPENIAGYAGYYSTVLAFCLPARLISGKISSFFNAQTKTRPTVVTTALAVTLNLAFGLQLVLGIPFTSFGSYGFWACPVVTTCVEWFVTGIYYFVYCTYLRCHDQCWGAVPAQWSFFRDVFLAPVLARKGDERFVYYNEHIRPKIWDYAKLAFPANLALASDFWRMSVIGLLAGSLGYKDVGVFNASYRLAWMNLTIIGSFSTAACTQLGIAMGSGDGGKCKRIVGFGISTVASFLLVTIALTISFIEFLGSIFSSDPELIEMFVECRYAMGFMIFFMCFSMHFELVLFCVGKSKVVARASIVGSWMGQVPAVLLMIHLLGAKLQAVYFGVGIGYAFYFLLVFSAFIGIDWNEQARTKYEENKKKEPLVGK